MFLFIFPFMDSELESFLVLVLGHEVCGFHSPFSRISFLRRKNTAGEVKKDFYEKLIKFSQNSMRSI